MPVRTPRIRMVEAPGPRPFHSRSVQPYLASNPESVHVEVLDNRGLFQGLLEVATNLGVLLHQVLLAAHVVPARWRVRVDVLRAQAVHGVGREPGARSVGRNFSVILLALVLRVPG